MALNVGKFSDTWIWSNYLRYNSDISGEIIILQTKYSWKINRIIHMQISNSPQDYSGLSINMEISM